MNQPSSLSPAIELPHVRAIPQSEQNILAQLNDIYTPEPIGFWPPSLIASTAIIIAAILLLSLAYYFYRRTLNNKYRRYALTALSEIRNADLSIDSTFNQVNTLLKRCAISGNSDHKRKDIIVKIWGDTFYRFLFDTSKPYKHIPAESTDSFIRDLASLHYALEQTNRDTDELMHGYLEFAEHWIKTHDKKSLATVTTKLELSEVRFT